MRGILQASTHGLHRQFCDTRSARLDSPTGHQRRGKQRMVLERARHQGCFQSRTAGWETARRACTRGGPIGRGAEGTRPLLLRLVEPATGLAHPPRISPLACCKLLMTGWWRWSVGSVRCLLRAHARAPWTGTALGGRGARPRRLGRSAARRHVRRCACLEFFACVLHQQAVRYSLIPLVTHVHC